FALNIGHINRLGGARIADWDGGKESRADADLDFNVNIAADQLRQLARQWKSQASSFSGLLQFAFNLLPLLKNALAVRRCDSDSRVRNREHDRLVVPHAG